LLIAGYFTSICLVFHGEDRYRLPILPWILLEAAVVVARKGVEDFGGVRGTAKQEARVASRQSFGSESVL
jgi:hypothetical protein